MNDYRTKQLKALEALETLETSEALFIKASDIHKIINNAGCGLND